MGPRTFKATSEAVKSRSKNRILFEFSPSFPLPHARGAEVQICAIRNALSDELNDLSEGAANRGVPCEQGIIIGALFSAALAKGTRRFSPAGNVQSPGLAAMGSQLRKLGRRNRLLQLAGPKEEADTIHART